MIKKINLAKKLTVGFTIVLLLLSVVGVTAYLSLDESMDRFFQYREMARDTNFSSQIQENMLMVRMNAKDYIITGNDKDKSKFDQYWEETEQFMIEAKKETNSSERTKIISQVDKQLLKYKAAFEQIVELISTRNELVKNTMDVHGLEAEKVLTKILIVTREDGNMLAEYRASSSIRNLLLARLYAGKFLETNSESDAVLFEEEYDQIQEQITMMYQALQNPAHRALLNIAAMSIELYFEAFTEVVEVINTRNSIIQNTLDKLGPEIAQGIEGVKVDIKATQRSVRRCLVRE